MNNIGEPSLAPPEAPEPGELCAECGADMTEGYHQEVTFPRKQRITVWVCSSRCEDAYLAGWGDYMFNHMEVM